MLSTSCSIHYPVSIPLVFSCARVNSEGDLRQVSYASRSTRGFGAHVLLYTFLNKHSQG